MKEESPAKNENQHKEKKPMEPRRKILYGLLATLGLVITLIVGRYVNVMFINPMSAFDKPPAVQITPEPVEPQAPQNAPVAVTTPAPTPTLSPEEALKKQADAEFMKNKVNILLLGWDQSPEREDEDSKMYRDEDNNFRSDVLILLTIDFETKRVDMISIPRDTYAPIYNTKGRWKINAAFAKGGSVEGEGFLYAMNTVSNLLGVPIDLYAGVDMIGLKAVVDAMGGVDYDVDVRIKLNGRVLEKGYQHMDGQQVLDYCRARKGISTDVGRADRQQRMLFSIFEQLKSRNQLINIPKIYNSVQDKVKTNLNSEQIAALTVFALGLDMEDLHRHTLEGSYVNDVYNASFYVLNNSKLKALVKEIFDVSVNADNRYDISYVQADKAASKAMPYLEGASYLLEVFGRGAQGADIVSSCMTELNNVTDRSIAVSNGNDSSPLDKQAIESAQHKLFSAMLNYCRRNNITQAQLDLHRVPLELYNQLAAPEQEPEPEQTMQHETNVLLWSDE